MSDVPDLPGVGQQRGLLARLRAVVEAKDAEVATLCSRCGTGLAGAQPAGASWAQMWDVSISRLVTETSA